MYSSEHMRGKQGLSSSSSASVISFIGINWYKKVIISDGDLVILKTIFLVTISLRMKRKCTNDSLPLLGTARRFGCLLAE